MSISWYSCALADGGLRKWQSTGPPASTTCHAVNELTAPAVWKTAAACAKVGEYTNWELFMWISLALLVWVQCPGPHVRLC
eukprot:5301915-Amphidinium_carterae.1